MKNRRGFTVIELVVSFALISIIVVGMLTIALRYRNDAQLSTQRLALERYRDTLTKAIQEDIVEYGIENIEYCTSEQRTCLTLTFDDGSTKNLELSNVNVEDRYIRYGGRKFEIEEDFEIAPSDITDASITLPYVGIQLKKEDLSNNTIYKIDIPITYIDIEGDFGIHIVALKNVNAVDKKNVTSIFEETKLGEDCKIYDDGTDTFLVGKCSKNYVWYSGKLWRVVSKNNATGAVKMVTDNAMTTISYQDSSTTFEDSYVDQWLTQEFLPTLHHYENYLVEDSIWDATLDASDTPVRPMGTTLVTRTVGLLNAYEYYTTYNNSDGVATETTGYLNSVGSDTDGIVWSLMTPYSTTAMRYVSETGTLKNDATTLNSGVRPAVNIKAEIQLASGDGTSYNPYRFVGDSQETINGTTLLTTRYIGEYVTFNQELYRIVNIENDRVKIVAVNKPETLKNTSFHSTAGVANFASASIKTDLENYYQNLDSTAKDLIEENTTWYLGTVGSGANYKASICASVDIGTSIKDCTKTSASTTANIGLERIGEMFASHITKENKEIFWTLTPTNGTTVFALKENGTVSLDASTSNYGVRPSVYLKATVKIASTNTGNGTYEKPYQLSNE